MRVKVIGAGFSGLAISYALVKRGIGVDLYEKSSTVGGLISSEKLDWGLVESAANGIRATQNSVDLFEDIQLSFLQMKKENRKRFIFREKAKQLPLSPLEITRMSVGMLRRPKPRIGQNVQSYAESIFGYGAANYLIEPILFGIFGERAENLSASLIYDYFFKYRSQSSAKAKGTIAPVNGMGELISSMLAYLKDQDFKLNLNKTTDIKEGQVTVIATDSQNAAELLELCDEWVSDRLKAIEYLPLHSVTLGFAKSKKSLSGFGCLFPASEDFHSLGVLFNNDIFENRGPYTTETWILNSSDVSPEVVRNQILLDRGRLFQLNEEPDEVKMNFWPRALPHYSTGLEKILGELVLPNGVHLVGNYLGRMGLAKILDQCHEVADRIKENES